ncbi:MAG: hypothetical protein A2W00_09655 [Candidatus Eisenbacteria bacterium RBG_16_71_46]|nr:MAG: hypothetical protein A2W00_09655 [Candidatus Eisenbacteria bacterium RBG_16_71_46]
MSVQDDRDRQAREIENLRAVYQSLTQPAPRPAPAAGGAPAKSGGAAGRRSAWGAVIAASFFAASYLVNMTFLNQELVRRGETWRLGVVPASFGQFLSVVSLGFGLMDLVFLAIVVYQAWSIPRPLKLPAPAAP